MAAGGGATTAYRCSIDSAGKLVAVPTTALRSECLKASDAMRLLSESMFAVVAGSDMVALRELIGGLK